MRLPKPWTKKRGSRLLSGTFSGVIGETMLLAGLFLLGVFTFALMLFQRFASQSPAGQAVITSGIVSDEASASALGFWIVIVLALAMITLGAAGLVYRLARIGASDERRSAFAGRAGAIELMRPGSDEFECLPTVPFGRGVTDSPGVFQAYRLASDGSSDYRLVAASAALALLWNAVWFVLLAVVVNGFLHDRPRWVLTFLLFPFAAIGWWAFRYFVDSLKKTAGLGSTIVEISDHPLQPGREYTLYASQAGKLNLRRLRVELVCEEETTYRQGTDVRIDRHRAYTQILHTQRDLTIDPYRPWSQELAFTLPADAMHSFQSAHNAVCWKITVSGEARPWPSFCRNFPVVVHPPGGPQKRVPR